MSTEPSTADMNRIIALFDGYEEIDYYGKMWFTKDASIGCTEEIPYDRDYNSLHSAWVKFRDLDIEGNVNAGVHKFYSGTVGYAIIKYSHSEAYKALYDAIVWYNSLSTKP